MSSRSRGKRAIQLNLSASFRTGKIKHGAGGYYRRPGPYHGYSGNGGGYNGFGNGGGGYGYNNIGLGGNGFYYKR